MSADSIVILSHPTALLTKRWYVDDKGKPKQDDYGFAKTFEARTIQLANFGDLSELLGILATEPRRCIIRGDLIPGRDPASVLRRKNARGDEPAYFKEVPRRWVMLDVDLKDQEIRVDWATKEGCLAGVNLAIARLPIECRVAGCWWQLSSSAAFKPGIRCHLWFWLDRPLGETELTRWGEFANEQAGKAVVDVSVFRTVQPNYTANPVFDGLVDPVAQRVGVITGPNLVLPRLAPKTGVWRKKLEPLLSSTNTEIHKHIRDACASYFCSLGPDAPDNTLLSAIKQAVATAEELQDRQGDYSEDKILAEIVSGREFAKDKAVLGESLLLNSDGTPKSTIGNAYAILQSSEVWHELVGYNKRENRVELLREPPWGGGPRPWADEDSVRAAMWFAREQRMAIEDGPVYRAVSALAKDITFDPVTDWLNSLVWDGVNRLDSWLIDWCGAVDKPYNRKVSRIWPISAVARALCTDPEGVQVDTVLILQGATGTRKTSLFRMLGGKYYAAVIDEKDLVQKIHGPWIVEFPELGPFNHRDVNKIKGFVDQKKDRYRIPYGRIPEDKTRGNVLVASTNEYGWQEDPTSARRFWPVDIAMIDLEKVVAEQLWAEAVQAYKAGEEWWVEATDPDFVEEQEKQYAHDPWEESIMIALRDGKSGWGNGGEHLLILPEATEISTRMIFLNVLADARMNKADQTRISKCMRKLGWIQDGLIWRGKPFRQVQARVDRASMAS